MKKYPHDELIRKKYERSKAIAMTQVLKKHGELSTNLKDFELSFMKEHNAALPSISDYKKDKDILKIYKQKSSAEALLRHWNVKEF